MACPSEEKESLITAAMELDNRMKQIRQSGTVIGLERIAVMAALNLAHEVLDSSGNQSEENSANIQLIDDMCHRVDALLSR